MCIRIIPLSAVISLTRSPASNFFPRQELMWFPLLALFQPLVSMGNEQQGQQFDEISRGEERYQTMGKHSNNLD